MKGQETETRPVAYDTALREPSSTYLEDSLLKSLFIHEVKSVKIFFLIKIPPRNYIVHLEYRVLE